MISERAYNNILATAREEGRIEERSVMSKKVESATHHISYLSTASHLKEQSKRGQNPLHAMNYVHIRCVNDEVCSFSCVSVRL